MLALSPSNSFSNFNWPIEDAIGHEQPYNNIFRETETDPPDSFPDFPPSQPEFELDHHSPTSFTVHSGTDPNMVKKLNHNASERDRRKKINGLYSSLRSLLPATDQSKKLSIPATVSRVLKYIPELQRQVERLAQKKEELLSKMSSREEVPGIFNQEKGSKLGNKRSSLSTVSANRIADTEVVVQISTNKVHKSPLSEILLNLEEDGLVLINSSSFESFEGRVFYTLHLQEWSNRLECEALSQKFRSLYEKSEPSFPGKNDLC